MSTVTASSSKDKYTLVDTVAGWLIKKNASYLSKEGLIVYYASMTGRKSDYQWFKITLSEVVRIISASELSADTNIPLKPEHVITACQENDRVYEMGMSSRHPVLSHIFNYLEHEDNDLATQVMQALARELFKQGFEAFRRSDMLDIYSRLNTSLMLGATPRQITDMYWPAFCNVGYTIRDKQHRVQLDGYKQCVFMLPGLKPKSVVHISKEAQDRIYNVLYAAYK